ncbi:hypothetical protein CAPTEDRAFT_218332 [Capitella teleta]|uniref:Uncharacterized protein n=1 Tax=Capitella teleta TaxID=283909 RepID=R7ULC2_CAPTE|nr:hypothetical protein CAPTEDRAFT_218332 [Capitella teleta]|eukprot:ELU06898.1 hypothetical protein CAPTEDRAFT_218332 [Capitella teleta]
MAIRSNTHSYSNKWCYNRVNCGVANFRSRDRFGRKDIQPFNTEKGVVPPKCKQGQAFLSWKRATAVMKVVVAKTSSELFEKVNPSKILSYLKKIGLFYQF